jgi:hypothetical protein
MAYHIGSLLGTLFWALIFFLGARALMKKSRESGSTGYKVGGYVCYGLFALAALRFLEMLVTGH